MIDDNNLLITLSQDFTSEVLEKLTLDASQIVVKDWQDEENYKKAKSLRTKINSLYDKVNRRKIDLKNLIEDKAKLILIEIDKPLDHLSAQLKVRDDELKRQKAENQKKLNEIASLRFEELSKYEDATSYMLHPDYCDEEKYQLLLAKAKLQPKKSQAQETPTENNRINEILKEYPTNYLLASRIVELENILAGLLW